MRNTVIGLILLAGCGSTIPEPDNAVVGIWGGTRVELRVSTSGAVLQRTCLAVSLPAFEPDEFGHFDVIGKITEASWSGAVGRDYRIHGSIEGPVMAMYGQTRYDAGWTETSLDTLSKGVEGAFWPPGGGCIV
jgi:hypothetical protein